MEIFLTHRDLLLGRGEWELDVRVGGGEGV